MRMNEKLNKKDGQDKSKLNISTEPKKKIEYCEPSPNVLI